MSAGKLHALFVPGPQSRRPIPVSMNSSSQASQALVSRLVGRPLLPIWYGLSPIRFFGFSISSAMRLVKWEKSAVEKPFGMFTDSDILVMFRVVGGGSCVD